MARLAVVTVVLVALAAAPARAQEVPEPAPIPTDSPPPANYKRAGLFIGIAAGAGMVFFAGAWKGCKDDGECGRAASGTAVWAGIGGSIGALMGHMLTPNERDFAPDAARPGTPEFMELVGRKRVTVTTADGYQYVGVFSREGLMTGFDTEAVPFAQIVRVDPVTNRVPKGLLVGLLTGVGVGLIGLHGSCREDCQPKAFFIPTTVGAAAGMALGWGMNLTNRERDVIYDASFRSTPPVSTRTMMVVPIISRTHKGAVFTMTWR